MQRLTVEREARLDGGWNTVCSWAWSLMNGEWFDQQCATVEIHRSRTPKLAHSGSGCMIGTKTRQRLRRTETLLVIVFNDDKPVWWYRQGEVKQERR
uniref:Uncharacterized protein n=1 Tax=Cucumis sativus TaxID=3659 RepID=A0A0A0L8L7_CUCSA